MEDPDYLPSHWHSAVSEIIARVQNSTAADTAVGKTNPGFVGSNVKMPGQAVAGTGAAGDAAAGHTVKSVATNTATSAHHLEGMAGGGGIVVAPVGPSPAQSPAPSTIVVPILVPYPVEPVVPSTFGVGAVGATALAGSTGHSSTASHQPPVTSHVGHNYSSGTPLLPLPPPTIFSGNISFTNQTAGGTFTSSSPDVPAAVGWSFLALFILLAGLAAFALSTSKKLRVWLRSRLSGAR